MGLTPEQAARQITTTPKGQFSLYDEKKGEVVKSDRWRPPDFRSLIKVAQAEQGRSEVSCVLEEIKSVVMARPMIFSDETGQLTLLLPIKLVCRPTKSQQTGLYPTNLLVQSKAISGLPTWRCHPVAHQPCHQPRSCHGNHIPMVLPS